MTALFLSCVFIPGKGSPTPPNTMQQTVMARTSMLAGAEQEDAAESLGRRIGHCPEDSAGFTECRQQCIAGRDVAACKDCEGQLHRSQSAHLDSFLANNPPLRRAVSDSSALPPPQKFVRRYPTKSEARSTRCDVKVNIENISSALSTSFDDDLFLMMMELSIMRE